MVLLGVSFTYGEEPSYQWKKEKEKNGITVYSSKTPNSEFRTYKAVGLVDHPWEVLFEVLLDVPGYTGWMPGCRKSSIIKMVHDDPVKGNFIIHLVWDAIWPVKNRDLVVEVHSEHDWDNDFVKIVLKGTDRHEVPVPDGLLRIKEFYSRFDFRYVDRTHTEVVFLTMVNPGGGVPAGVAEIQTSTVPYDTLRGLADRAKDPKYYKQAMADYY